MYKAHDVQVLNPKPPAFVIFADLDGTFTPMDITGKVDFANVVKEIHDKGAVQVKFVPVSGRPAGYVLRVLHDTRDMLQSMDVGKVCDFGAAEQGALVVDSSKSYYPQYIGGDKNLNLKQGVAKIIENSPYAKIVKDEPDKIYTCSIHITNEAKENMDRQAQRKVYESIRDDILKEYDVNRLDISMSHNCMEVMSKSISKAKSMDVLLWRYRKEYNVLGVLYAGDAENDKKALVYTSKLAEIPGMTAHVFEPANAQEIIDSNHLEAWKNHNKSASKNRIRKGDYTMFKGITQLIRDELSKGTLFGVGSGVGRTLDDDALQLRRKISDEHISKIPPISWQFLPAAIKRKLAQEEAALDHKLLQRYSENGYFPNYSKILWKTKYFDHDLEKYEIFQAVRNQLLNSRRRVSVIDPRFHQHH